ncbi:MAG TPA: hypothetical protein DCM54_11645 [Gammaproteobacteria bacterium]|nr:hypothetical protein [Gammaproteobacteria bacterium]
MVYIIIGTVLLLIIAPIVAVLPSARQKQQMAMRRQAMGLGVNVEITSITDPIPKQEKYLSSTGKQLEPNLSVTAYRVARKMPQSWRKIPLVNWTIERRVASEGDDLPGTWCWDPNKPNDMSKELTDFIVAEIVSMPDDVVRVDENNRIISGNWHERGDVDGVQQIATFLDGCARRPEVKVDDDFEDGADGGDDLL